MQTQPEPLTYQGWVAILAQHQNNGGKEYRRRHPRDGLTSLAVQISFTTRAGAQVRGGTLLNASRTGIMIWQQEAVPQGTDVVVQTTLNSQVWVLRGKVVHSTRTVGGVKVGISLVFQEDAEGPRRKQPSLVGRGVRFPGRHPVSRNLPSRK